MRFSPGTRFGPYTVISLLGAGGTGEVYRARDERAEREVAIRVLRDELVGDRRLATLFESDARAIAGLGHRNIVAILEFDVDLDPPIVVCELLEGASLRQRMVSRPSWQKAAAIGAEIAEGLGAAHDRGVTHCDLKPENVFLTSDGGVKILDFGIAHLKEGIAGGIPTHTQPGSSLPIDAPFGTTGYASPEQVRFEEPSAASDIFSLGAILYEMATGSNPFARDTAVETSAAILHDEPQPLEDVLVDVPAAFARLVKRCLEKKADERPESARALAADLREMLRAAEVERVYPGRQKRRRLAMASLAAAVLVTLGALFLITRGMIGTPAGNAGAPASSVAILPVINATGDPAMDAVAEGLTVAVIDRLLEVDVRVAPRATAARHAMAGLGPGAANAVNTTGAVVTTRLTSERGKLVVLMEVADAGRGGEVWRRTITRDRSEIPALPGDVAQSVARRMGVKLTRSESARLARPATGSNAAFAHYLRGIAALRLLTRTGDQEAIAALEAAVTADPGFARAHAALGEAYLRASRRGGGAEAKARARQAVSRAVALDPLLAEAHVALGLLRLWDEWELDAAEAEFRRAIELNGNLGPAHAHYATVLVMRGWPERAIDEARRATELEPRSRESAAVLAGALLHANRADDAAAALRRFLAADPGFAAGHALMGRVQEARGDGAAACLELLEARRLDGASAGEMSALGGGCREGGLKGYHRALLRILDERELASDAPEIALAHAALGETDEAAGYLEVAFEERAGAALAVAIDPLFAPMRDDPRVESLLRRAGLLERPRVAQTAPVRAASAPQSR